MSSWERLTGAEVKIGHGGVESRRGKALNGAMEPTGIKIAFDDKFKRLAEAKPQPKKGKAPDK